MMMMPTQLLRYLALTPVLMSLGLLGCATPYKMITSFDADQTREMLQPGPNRILGNALIRQKGGGVVTCAGSAVYLIPATPYAKERTAVLYGSPAGGFIKAYDVEFESNDPLYLELRRKTLCDAQGDFEFNNVADGEFYIATRIVWELSFSTEGGYLKALVSVQGGQTAKVVLTP